MKAAFLGLWLPVLSFAADGKPPGTCYIYVKGSAPACHYAMQAGPEAAAYYKMNAYFADTDPIANMNAGRCLERAQEYKYWCEIPAPAKAQGSGLAPLGNVEWVAVYYQVNGVNLIASVANSENKTYLSDGVARYLRWHD